MVKVDDVDDFKTFGASKPQNEEPFLKAATKMVQTLGFYGPQKGGITLDTSKENFSPKELDQLENINQRLTHAVNKHQPSVSIAKRPKKTKK